MSAPILGICTFCFTLLDLDRAGNLVEHSMSRWGKRECPGSRLAPRERKKQIEPALKTAEVEL